VTGLLTPSAVTLTVRVVVCCTWAAQAVRKPKEITSKNMIENEPLEILAWLLKGVVDESLLIGLLV
jgi:hypothetical protein